MSTAVVQLFTTDAPAHSAWHKRLSGIACFVRDSSKRSYFIRVYCMIKHELVWEEEMYDTIIVGKPHDFLICFEGEVCVFWLRVYIEWIFIMCILPIGLYGGLELC